jgi:hypothetical protein
MAHMAIYSCVGILLCGTLRAMNQQDFRAALNSINLMQFSKRHDIPRRTLHRLKLRGHTPNKRTLTFVMLALLQDRDEGLLK